MVFQTADLREEFTAAKGFACPDFVHSVCHVIPHVGDNEVLGLLGVEFRLLIVLLDGLALVQDSWYRSGE